MLTVCTAKLAEAALPVPPSFELSGPVVLFFVPNVTPVTFTEKVQEALAPNVAPDMTTELDPAVAAMAPPPQEPVRPLGVATTRPAGKVSLKPTPVNWKPLELAMVKLRLVVPPTAMLAAPNDALMVGGLAEPTVTLAEAVPPVPPSVELTVPVVLFLVPTAVPVTLTEKMQEPPGTNVPPARLTEPDAAVAVTVPLPQVPVRPLGVDTTRPAGKVSVKATPLSDELALGLVTVKLRLVVPPIGILAAPNNLLMVGALGELTITLAEAVPPVPPSVELTVPVVLFLVPAVVPVTFTEKVQEPLAANVPPARLTEPDAAVAVMVPPPQVPERPVGVDTTRPAGKESVNATPLSDALALGLVTVKLRLVLPPAAMCAAPNTLPMVGGSGGSTVTLAEAGATSSQSVHWTVLVVLFCTPTAMPVTFTEKVHEVLGGMFANNRLTRLDAAVAVMLPPPQVPVSPLGVDMTKPVGRVSLKLASNTQSLGSGLVRVKLRLVLPPNGMCVAPNALLMVGVA